jgi:hypothetical protein
MYRYALGWAVCHHARAIGKGALAVVLIVGAAACSTPPKQQSGIITFNDSRSFCVGLPAAAGFCATPAWARNHNLPEMRPGDCVRVTYSGAKVDPSNVTKVEPVAGCHSPAPTEQ